MRPRALVVLLLLVLAFPALAQQDATLSRLAILAKIWGTARYAHPAFGHRDIDWDAAGVRAIERTRAAGDWNQFADAVDEMLSVLGDPVSRIAPLCIAGLPPGDNRPAHFVADGVLFLPSSVPPSESLKSVLRNAHTVIVDLRAMSGCTSEAPLSEELMPLLFRGTIELPDQRRVLHQGYRTQEPDEAFTGYTTSYIVQDRGSMNAAPDSSVTRTVFLINEHSLLPPIAIALAATNRGAILSVGPMRTRSHVAYQTFNVGNYTAYVRTSELIDNQRRPAEPRITTLSADASEEAILAAALDGGGSGKRRSAGIGVAPLPEAYDWKLDETYRAMHYPAVEYRVLAAFRLWNIIDLFYGYKQLIGDWDAQLQPILSMLIAASSQREYDLALAKAMTLVPDGHSWVFSPGFLDLRGRFAPPFFLMPVEGKPVVVEIRHPIATENGVKLGDELLSIDDRPVAERIEELRPYISASTDTAMEYYLVSAAPNGPAGLARFTFRRPNGSTYEATLARSSYVIPDPAKAWRVMPGNIGYVDLRYLKPEDVSTMISELSGTKGMVLDIRTYPRGVFPALGQRMNVTGSSVIAQIRIPRVVGTAIGTNLIRQDIGRNNSQTYRGKTIALIDERAQSQSEHTCLTLEAVAGTKFVGSPTVGANGNVTHMVMPGSIYVMFTGMDVRHADGRQLQRVGVLPDYPVPRTIAALAAGRDEVLERAVEILND